MLNGNTTTSKPIFLILNGNIHRRLSTGGPEALEPLDLVVLGALILLALELLNILVKFFSRGSKRIPVRGKHLDVLSSVSIKLI